MRRDTILRKNASQTFKKLRGTDWVVERMYQVLSQGKRAFDSLMLEMGQMVAEAIKYIDREEVAGPDYFPFKAEIQKWASQQGSVFIGDQKVVVEHPRLRGPKGEMRLRNYEACVSLNEQATDPRSYTFVRIFFTITLPVVSPAKSNGRPLYLNGSPA